MSRSHRAKGDALKDLASSAPEEDKTRTHIHTNIYTEREKERERERERESVWTKWEVFST
jgi:hypothetical protein